MLIGPSFSLSEMEEIGYHQRFIFVKITSLSREVTLIFVNNISFRFVFLYPLDKGELSV